MAPFKVITFFRHAGVQDSNINMAGLFGCSENIIPGLHIALDEDCAGRDIAIGRREVEYVGSGTF